MEAEGFESGFAGRQSTACADEPAGAVRVARVAEPAVIGTFEAGDATAVAVEMPVALSAGPDW